MAVRSYGHDIDYSYICINCDLDIKDRILVKGQNIPTIVGIIIQIRQGVSYGSMVQNIMYLLTWPIQDILFCTIEP